LIRYTGQRLKRVEDPRLLRGRGRFIADVALPGSLTVAFVRSPYAHARVLGVDTAAAAAMPGVVRVVTASDLAAAHVKALSPSLDGDGFVSTSWPALAGETVRFCGEAVAAVLADGASCAEDACEAVSVEYEPRPAVVSLAEALASRHVLFRRAHRHGDVDGAFARAAVVVSERFTHARCAPSPIEPRGSVAHWDGERLTVWSATQVPHILRAALAAALDLALSEVRVVVPDVGGGFGLKMQVLPEDVAVAAIARLVPRPVRWIETRREHLLAASQARGQQLDADLAVDATGALLGLRARVVSDAGAYHSHPLTQALEPLGAASILPGPYVVPAYAYEAVAAATNKPPLGAYRGVGMTMGAFVMERLLDLAAARLGVDPVEVRRRNLIGRDAYPYTSASGMTYDSGDFPKALAQALDLVGYDALRREQAREQQSGGRRIGIGLGCYTEYTGMGAEVFRRRGMDDVPGIEAATVAIDPDGGARCLVSFPSQGQGHATVVAQLVADRLGIPLDRVRVEPVDTFATPAGSGTFGSRGVVSMHGTVATAADAVRTKMTTLAAHLLEAATEDIVLDGSRLCVRGVPDRFVSVADVARLAYAPPRGGLPAGVTPGLEATVYFDPGPATFSGAVHVAVVEVDAATGLVRLLRHAVVEDCGPIVNPLIVDGQIHGAVAQGAGEALLEGVVYDDEGQLVTGTFMDYALPRATDVPTPEIGHVETPAPGVPGGVKGMGEGGTIGAPAAIANAVADALRDTDVRITELPIRREPLALALARAPVSRRE
jgi:carbon-monoxide dehydrogenase large subunit